MKNVLSILMTFLTISPMLMPMVRGAKPPAPNGVQSMTTYESRIGESGFLLENPDIQMWVPASYEDHSAVIFDYLATGYANLSNIFGDYEYPHKFSIEHYPEGSPYAWGGTDAKGTIRYGYGNLEDDTTEWNQYGVPHVIGYYEEMAHCFTFDLGIRGEFSVGFYEMLGMVIGGETTLRAAWNPYIQDRIEDSFRTFAATTAYYLEHNTGEPGVPENIYLTRILAHILKTEVIDVYGWEILSETFKAAQEGYPLRDYDRDHTWGGFLGFLGDVTRRDMHSVFGNYGLPILNWTGEPGFEFDGFEPLNNSDRCCFRIKVVDREGPQLSDVRVHLYRDASATGESYTMDFVDGNVSVGWIYETEIDVSELYGWEYAFSANDGVHQVFQAVGQPTEKQLIARAPDFTLTDIDGVEFSLSDYMGKVVLLDFFATWCGPCVAEIPHLQNLLDDFGEDLVIVSISVSPSSDSGGKLQEFRQEHEIDWIIARDTIGMNDEYGVQAIPTLVIIDQDGFIRHQHIGLTDELVLQEEIHEIMPKFLKTDLNNDGIVNIQDLFTVAKAFGSSLGQEKWNSNADLNEDGKVNIQDLFKVAKDFGKTV